MSDKYGYEYRVDIKKWPGEVRASYKGIELALSCNTLRLEETAHEPVFYFPVEDVRMEVLEANEHDTYCPLKGSASYWSFESDGKSQKNIAWAYCHPIKGVAEIKDHIAFYSDLVDIETTT